VIFVFTQRLEEMAEAPTDGQLNIDAMIFPTF
jgi:hypothetical protein